MSDDYGNTGCYNLECPGFVQKSRTIVPGTAIKDVSSYNNKLYDLPFFIYKVSHAIVGVTGGIYRGVEAAMDVWGPLVVNPTEFSSSYISVRIGGESQNGDVYSIETGWQVHPNMYHDQVPRLYVYWSYRSDVFQNTGCYNLDCPGFVQISKTIVPGGAITHVSPYHNMLQDLSFSIYKDSFDGNWWVEVKKVKVGYWPWKMFSSHRYETAIMIQLGGEIVNTGKYGNHTKTEMGSGQFSNKGYGQAACFKNITIYGSSDRQDPVDLNLITYNENPKCYTTKLEKYDTKLGNHFFYGGPGGADKGCK
ncbi:hypothetical protein CASFOL_020923 [Castilleja foliolosa]|uniref:Neprosin PEP catalytic domain-containing protein n=1 Tax=Castilleja foliolosa TaxID=1961234 RepID=A0ABD3D4C2_9LAMI